MATLWHSKIWVFAESADGKATSATLELLTKARELGVDRRSASTRVPTPTRSRRRSASTARPRCSSIDPGDGAARPGRAPRRSRELVGEHKPDAILFAQSYDGRDAIARLSVKLDRPVLTNGMSL